jgi:uncharacterized membrane protein YvlD (DUF360 family)
MLQINKIALDLFTKGLVAIVVNALCGRLCAEEVEGLNIEEDE